MFRGEVLILFARLDVATTDAGTARVGAAEVRRDAVQPAFTEDLQRCVPQMRSDQPVATSVGRAQAVGESADLVDGITSVRSAVSLHVVGAPSPASTASSSMARVLAREAVSRAELGQPVETGYFSTP